MDIADSLNVPSLGSAFVAVVRPILDRIHKVRFAHSVAPGFRGVFPDFESANRAAPKTKPLGFNCSEYAEEFKDRLEAIYSYDYPMLFWLERILRSNSFVFDFGGHIGVHFYAYPKYLSNRQSRWVVCDLPAIIAKGEQIARERGASGLEFTTEFSAANRADILIAAGSIQYVEKPSFAALLKTLDAKPRHLLLNKLPLYDGRQFVTLQNGVVAFHPQYVFNKQEFIDSILGLGYELVDQWAVDSRRGRIPFHPNHSFAFHTGLYFKLSGV
jgi:putative methyltransferase (TIGR04325 family)